MTPVMHAKQSNDYEPNTWKRLRLSDGGWSASYTCAKCGQTAVLIDHTIREDGQVQPSVVCPFGGCGFHEWVILVGWPGG